MSDFSLTDIFNMREKEIYYVSNHISKHYKRVEIPKKTKGVRILYIPSKKLMYMQRIILNAFLSETEYQNVQLLIIKVQLSFQMLNRIGIKICFKT